MCRQARNSKAGIARTRIKTLLAQPEGNQQEIEKCRNIAGDATSDKRAILDSDRKTDRLQELQEDQMQSFGDWVLKRPEDSILQM